MSDREEDRADLDASRRALADAKTAAVETDEIIASLTEASDNIRAVLEPNGYVNRFRMLLRGA